MSFDYTIPSYEAITPENVTKVSLINKVDAEGVPKVLKSLNRFTVWKPMYDEKGLIKKQPFDKNGKYCSWSDVTNLMSFDEAYNILSKYPEFGGIQFALFKMDGISSSDYDHVIDESGTVAANVLKDLEIMGYPFTEFSPSVTGLRVFYYAEFPKAQYHTEGLPEFYSDKKLLTVTGHHFGSTKADVSSVPTTQIMQILRSYYPEDGVERGPADIPRSSETYTDRQVISKILDSKAGKDFQATYYDGKDIKNDDNVTDYYTISKMTFYTQDLTQIYNLMLESALKRDKWIQNNSIDAAWEEEVDKASLPRNYLTRSITKALSKVDKVYKEVGKTEFYKRYGTYFCNSAGIWHTEPHKIPRSDSEGGKAKYDIVNDDVRICSTPAYISSTGYNKKTGNFYVKLSFINHAGVISHKWMQPETLTVKSKLLTLANDLSMDDESAGKLTRYFRNAIDEAANGIQEDVYSSIGYQNDYTCYILGDRKITASSIELIVPLDMPLASKLCKCGTLAGYVEAGKFLMKYDVLRAKFYGMMSSLLLDLVYSRNITLTHVATSGGLKGDSSWFIMGAFGNPITLQLNPSSTSIGFQGHMAQMEGLPTSVEELTGHPEILKQIQYYTTSGVARTLGKRSDGVKGGQMLRSIVCANSETPIFTSKDRLGNSVRNLNLDEKITDRIDNDEIIDLEELINKNYGHAAELLIQIILQEKDNLKDLMKGFEAGLSEVGEGIPENRFKNMCAFVALSGFLCEKLFTKIGIPNKDPTKIVDKVMLANLGNGMTEPLYIKALRVLAEHYTVYRNDFKDADPDLGERETNHRRGFVERKCLCFLPTELETVLDKGLGVGQAAASLAEFEMNKIIKTRGVKKYRTDHYGIPVFKITKEALKKHAFLDLDAEIKKDEEEEEEEVIPEPTPNPKITVIAPVDGSPVFVECDFDSSAYFSDGV